MLDIKLIREKKEDIQKSLSKRGCEKDFNLDEIIETDNARRRLIVEVEKLKAEINKYSNAKPDPETIQQLRIVSNKIKKIDRQLFEVDKELKNKVSELPNIVAEDVVAGGKENNKVLKIFGKKFKFKFTPRDHIQLANDLELIDYERGAKMSGSGFWVYKGKGALLEWALLNYFIDFHRKNKYTFLIPPFLLTEKSAYTSGHLPKFRDDLFWTQDKLCLNATSEMMIGNYHRDEILEEKSLPIKYFAYSACFRREAGGYRKEERGIIRGHQFNKIEMFQFTLPEKSWEAFNELVKNAEKLTSGLGLHFQSVKLAAGDASSAMAKTIDIEAWIPSMNIYKEVSSISNALDYQARRGNIKYRNSKNNKNDFVHTLNGSGLATSRLIPAILEQYQQKDGSVKMPKVLKKYTGFNVIKNG
ncbi:MAG: serine--tRNA ligase [Candidatus Nealsonbacteria bacterium RIFCSPHIGHO2_01_FULL_38_55]|uniref:Serine--tRNA ligase n=2 Tax=Candidatus Nealsoniibacteriota TaxID=1817911 RepID=A0A1G2EK48_9BACT|nr:MAG: Serine-tRNA ligase [Parcubacteria group bacterium GW2011_GWA2_38_27]KKQ98711.1 MAG: Serine-tRNA ligase [Parcubacteria group bacterium GW2011_GWC2_39_11]OGZ19668.1 MAG: serine--tRNA ligase [Candidatus Nealsonbacteria bacterium RIFCSPHIGHO2_01_FULL_38_55]OGZ20736.1 MAG: serine--tRNA ligase [Candidatus Nealsonbacteria bacterium RIFCSPHIGHO2_02_38_10]OGZ20959.1 MAG: serine--tRNA ligase [Candidatus Nealsonbacteria bacterium RIFCSPHIGHO2_02_FULL_38_75]OGZ23155.1 MAG: serine--tRNA ligase [Can